MTAKDFARKWLTAAPLTGGKAMLCALIVLAVPTLIRAAVDGLVSTAGFVPYVPFVLIAALLLKWPHATAVALAAALLGDFLFVGPNFELLETANDIFGSIVFLASSALIIALGHAIKTVVADPLWLKGAGETSNGVVFSLERGQAQVSWHGERSFVHLGPEEEVAAMMQDFLAQLELGKHLNRKRS